MSSTPLHPKADHSVDPANAISGSGESERNTCILDRIEHLQNLADTIFKEIPEPKSSLCSRFLSELNAITHDVNQAFEHLKRVISTIRDGRSQWEEKNEGLIQQTGKQLHKVTETTETATHQILDAVEKVMATQSDNSQRVSEILSATDTNSESVVNILKELAGSIEAEQADTFQIMDYLQFQDITAQQIERAYKLLTEAEQNLVEVAMSFKPIVLNDLDGDKKRSMAYDPDAEYVPSDDKQSQIDALFGK